MYRADPSVWKRHWVVLQIAKKPESQKPFYYQFSWQVPRHNGAFSGGNLQLHIDPKRVEWEEYDIEVLRLAQHTNGLTPIGDLSEAKIIAWEIFLYCTDGKPDGLPPEVRMELYKSIDDDLAIDQRMQSQEKVVSWYQLQQSHLASRWDNVRTYYDPKNYATWLAELIHRMRSQEYRDAFCGLQTVA